MIVLKKKSWPQKLKLLQRIINLSRWRNPKNKMHSQVYFKMADFRFGLAELLTRHDAWVAARPVRNVEQIGDSEI